MPKIALTVFALSLVVSSALAIPLPSDVVPQEGTQLFGLREGQKRPEVPAEVLDKLSGTAVLTLDKAVLAARSEELRARLIRSPGDASIMHALGNVLYRQGGDKEAFALWQAANKKDPNLAPAEVMRDTMEIFSLLARGETGKAQTLLAEVEKRHAKQAHFHLIRAEQAMRGGNAKAAEQAYRRAYELAPNLYVSNLNLARLLEVMKRDTKETEKYYLAATKLAPKRAEVWAYLGGFQFRQKRAQEARESFGRARALEPAMPLAETRLAELSVVAGDYGRAREWYRDALARRAKVDEEMGIRAALGDVLLRLGRLEEARSEIETVLKHRELPPLVFALGTINEAEGKFPAAESNYRRVLEIMEGNPLAANNLAMLRIKQGKYDKETLSLASQANRALPNNAIVQSTYGCALIHAGQDAEAIKVLEPVVAATPDDAWARYCFGKGLFAVKRVADGKVQMQQVLRMDPKFPRRAEVERILSRGK